MSDNDAVVPMQIPYEEYRARQALEAQRQAKELEMDETVAGGRYVLDGQVVDSSGVPVKDAAADEMAPKAGRKP
jgi:protocatechuate 3,4-dioxygenase beta subunit